ncbi:MAG TPA: HEAT repeat domain-containing protein, partial [Gemmataceae bacterium]
GRLVGLLNSDRPEVMVAAAWGLRRLAVPDTLPVVLEYVRRRLGQVRGAAVSRVTPQEGVERQLVQLAQFFGQSGYRPADRDLRGMTQRPVGTEVRAAAFWSLGLLHAGEPVPELVTEFEGRVKDTRYEDPRVRTMAAIALGRMRAKDALATLRQYAGKEPSLDPANNACAWAVAQITGEPPPPRRTIEVPDRGWFLVPLK